MIMRDIHIKTWYVSKLVYSRIIKIYSHVVPYESRHPILHDIYKVLNLCPSLPKRAMEGKEHSITENFELRRQGVSFSACNHDNHSIARGELSKQNLGSLPKRQLALLYPYLDVFYTVSTFYWGIAKKNSRED